MSLVRAGALSFTGAMVDGSAAITPAARAVTRLVRGSMGTSVLSIGCYSVEIPKRDYFDIIIMLF
jgi:hypothetical protein